MKIVRFTRHILCRPDSRGTSDSSLFDAEIESRTKRFCTTSLCAATMRCWNFTEKFDGAKLTADQLAVTQVGIIQRLALRPMNSLPRGGGRSGGEHRELRQKNPNARAGNRRIHTAQRGARSLLRSRASAFTFPRNCAARLHGADDHHACQGRGAARKSS